MTEFRMPQLIDNSKNMQLIDVTPNSEAKFITGFELMSMDTEFVPMLFDNLIPQVGVWALIGASDTGKSMALRQIALCVAGGKSFIDIKCNAIHKRAIVVSTEDDELAISYLIRKQNKSIGLNNDQLSNIKFQFDTLNLIEVLQIELEKNPADLIIIDAFSDVFDGKDSNQNAQVRQFLNKFTQLANKYKCSIGFLHHTGKRTEELAPSKNNAIGSQGFEAKMRLVIELKLDKTTPDLRHFCVVKGNYLPQELKNSSILIRMDENLTFSNTGERVAYDKLNDSEGKPKKKEPSEIDDLLHFNCIRTFFINNKQFSQNELVRKLEHYWHIGDKVARRYVDYMQTKQWIVDVSNSATRRSFKNNLPP